MTLDEQMIASFVDKARSQIGSGIHYHMGGGSNLASSTTPADGAGLCDCSAFVCWCMGISKHQPDGTWLGTDRIHDDAHMAQDHFVLLDAPIVGCGVIYPGHTDEAGVRHAGHTAIVVACDDGLQIVDCSSSQNGITERAGNFFRTHAGCTYFVPVEATREALT